MKIRNRKLLVFVAATVLVCIKIIPPNVWMTVACFYIGGNVAQKYITKEGK